MFRILLDTNENAIHVLELRNTMIFASSSSQSESSDNWLSEAKRLFIRYNFSVDKIKHDRYLPER